jgi:hypothetical protein
MHSVLRLSVRSNIRLNQELAQFSSRTLILISIRISWGTLSGGSWRGATKTDDPIVASGQEAETGELKNIHIRMCRC